MTKNGYSGLCATCEGRAKCTYPHDEDRPTLFCEEFDWWWQYRMEAAAVARLRAPKPARHVSEVRETLSRYIGLCRTCEHQETCTFPKPAGGVWHCEEFV